MRFAQCKLREGSVASGSEILRFAQDDRAGLAGAEELSSAFEPCLNVDSRGDLLIAIIRHQSVSPTLLRSYPPGQVRRKEKEQ